MCRYDNSVIARVWLAGWVIVVTNLSERAFIKLMSKYGVSVFNAKMKDLIEDIDYA